MQGRIEHTRRRNIKKRRVGFRRRIVRTIAVLAVITAGMIAVPLFIHMFRNSSRSVQEEMRIRDNEPPRIEGVRELTVAAGSSISYKRGVTVTDNLDGHAVLTVYNSNVDLKTPGDYPVIYSAMDNAGNITRVSTVVHVMEADAASATEELVNARAREILSEITTGDMTAYEVAEAIFWWCHENIRYKDGVSKENWIQGAYHGLFEKQGDCYAYFAAAKCLLTQAGIENMDIVKIPSDTKHYWNLINLGEGWYHFDTVRRQDGARFFYTSDEELTAYSRAHNGSHNYNPADYPDIQ